MAAYEEYYQNCKGRFEQDRRSITLENTPATHQLALAWRKIDNNSSYFIEEYKKNLQEDFKKFNSYRIHSIKEYAKETGLGLVNAAKFFMFPPSERAMGSLMQNGLLDALDLVDPNVRTHAPARSPADLTEGEAIELSTVVAIGAAGTIIGPGKTAARLSTLGELFTSVQKVNKNLINQVQHEALKPELQQNMAKPIVKDVKLQSFINELYRPNAKVGNGSTADAIRYELSTGKKVGGKSHVQKGEDALVRLSKWLKNNLTASPGDRAAVENIISDLNEALGHIPCPKSIKHRH